MHWCGPALEGNTCTTHQKTSQLFTNCKRVTFRNLRFHPCFEQECDLMNTDFQSFSSSLPHFCPILHNVFQAHPQPFGPPEASHPKLCLDSPGSLGSTRKFQPEPAYFQTEKLLGRYGPFGLTSVES